MKRVRAVVVWNLAGPGWMMADGQQASVHNQNG